MIELWHNPRCSKSRQALALLEEAGTQVGIRRYLEDPPEPEALDLVLQALGMEPWELARTQEKAAGELGLDDLGNDRARWIEVMTENPILIERPIAIDASGAAELGRPPENVLRLLED